MEESTEETVELTKWWYDFWNKFFGECMVHLKFPTTLHDLLQLLPGHIIGVTTKIGGIFHGNICKTFIYWYNTC